MDFSVPLKKASLLNKVNKPRAALNILKHLYKLDARNLDVILEVVSAFENLTEWKKARAMLGKGIKLAPNNKDLWIRLSSLYKADEDMETAFKAINKGLSYNPDNMTLLIQKFHLLADLGRVNQMKRLVDDTITKYPDEKKDLLIERASIYQLLALHPKDEEEQVKDSYGKARAVKPLKLAINDLNDAMDCDERNFQLSLRLARLYKQLTNYDLALFTYDDTLSLINSEAEEFRKGIQQEREDCLIDSRNNTVQIEHSLTGNMVNLEVDDVITLINITTTNFEGDEENQFYSSEENTSQQKNDQVIQQQSKAMNMAENIFKNVCEPNAGYSRVNLAKSARKFCDQVEHEILKIDFFTLGDFEIKGLSQHISRQVFLRLFLSRDKMICAAAIEIQPPKLKLFAWLQSVFSGKWKTVRYVELESETADGVFKITNNNADAKIANNSLKIVNLSEKSTVYDIVLAHKIRLQKYGQRSYKLIPDIKGVFAFKERLSRAVNFNGERSGNVKEDDQKELDENQLGKVSYDIKSYFEMISRQTSVVKS